MNLCWGNIIAESVMYEVTFEAMSRPQRDGGHGCGNTQFERSRAAERERLLAERHREEPRETTRDRRARSCDHPARPRRATRDGPTNPRKGPDKRKGPRAPNGGK